MPHPTELDTWYLGNGIDFTEIRTGANPNPVDDVDTAAAKVWKITDISSDTRTITAIPDAGMEAETSVFDLLCHPDTALYPDMLFAATSTGLYRRDDDSASWTKILDGCCKMDAHWDGSTYTLFGLQQATYTVSGDTIASAGGVFKTTNPETVTSSVEWVDKTAGLYVDLTQLDISLGRVQSLIKFWFDYTDGEESSFVKPSSYLPNFDEIRCDPTNPDRVYLANGSRVSFISIITGGVWASMDGGDAWFAASRIGTGYATDSFWATRQPGQLERNMDLQVHENNFPDDWSYDIRGCRTMTMAADGTLYAGIMKGYYTLKYDADADWWTSVDNTQVGEVFYGHGNCDVGGFAVIPDRHRKGEMFLLQQEASAWKTVRATHPDFAGVVGAYEISGLQDEGPTWAPGSPYYVPSALGQNPSNSDVIYFLSPRTGYFYKSSDNGLSHEIMGQPAYVPYTQLSDNIYWRHLRVAPEAAAIYAVAEVIDTDNVPSGRVDIYSPTARKGIYKSTDEGVSWNVMNAGLPVSASGRDGDTVIATNSACVKGLQLAPEDSDILYAAVKRYYAPTDGYVNGGLYRTDDGATSWSAEGIPAGIKSLRDVWLHVENDAATQIYIAGGGDGEESELGIGGVWVADYKAGGGYIESDWTQIFDHPFCTHVTTSPFDGQRVLVATGESSGIDDLNMGLYFTFTGGAAGNGSDWLKLNVGRGPLRTTSIAFDTGNPDRIWASGESAGSHTLDLTPALEIIELSVDSAEVAGTNLVLLVEDGPPNGWMVLESKTNLVDTSWTALETGIAGTRSVTNPITGSRGFFRLVERVVRALETSVATDFVAPNCSDGALDGQQRWNAESGWTVSDSAGAGMIATDENGAAAVWGLPVQLSAGESCGLRITFEFEGSYSTPSGNVYAFLAGLKAENAAESVATDSAAADVNIQILSSATASNADDYRLLSNFKAVAGADRIDGATAGALCAGDLLQLDYELTLGADAASTSYTVRLQNLTAGADTGTGTVEGVDVTVYDALTGTGAFAFFQSISPGNQGSGLTGVRVYSFTVSAP